LAVTGRRRCRRRHPRRNHCHRQRRCLSQDIAAAPSKVYRYRGIGYARLLGLVAAPSYTATARRLDGCAVAVGSVEYDGEDEVRIDLRPVDGCDKTPTPVEPVTAQPIAPFTAAATSAPADAAAASPMPTRMASPTHSDLCPLLVGSSTNTSRPGCPCPDRRCPACADGKGGIQTATGYDFAVSTISRSTSTS
jgi:hypothetical protein